MQGKLAAARKLAEESEARRKAEEEAREAAEKSQKVAEKAQKIAEERTKEKSQANLKLVALSSAAIMFGFIAGFFGIQSQAKTEIAQLKQQAVNVQVKLSVDSEVENLIETIQIVGKNQQFKNSWLLPVNQLNYNIFLYLIIYLRIN